MKIVGTKAKGYKKQPSIVKKKNGGQGTDNQGANKNKDKDGKGE